MFTKLSTLALVLPLVSALTIDPLTNAQSASSVTITWTASTQDPPYFSIELVNEFFHNTFAIANNVQTSLGQLTVTLPELQDDDHYSIEAISTSNLNDVLSQSVQFSITTGSSSSSSSAASTTGSSSTASSSSASVTLSTPSATSFSTVSSPASSTVPATSAASSSAASASPSTLSSSGTASFKLAGVLPAAALVLSAVAGVAMVF